MPSFFTKVGDSSFSSNLPGDDDSIWCFIKVARVLLPVSNVPEINIKRGGLIISFSPTTYFISDLTLYYSYNC